MLDEEWEGWDEEEEEEEESGDSDSDSSWREEEDEEEDDDSAGSDVDESEEEQEQEQQQERGRQWSANAAAGGGAAGAEGRVPYSSIYRGVRMREGGRWEASIQVSSGRKQSLGTHDTEEEAARAYDEKAKQLHANAILNFLPDGSLNPDRKSKSTRPLLVKALKRPSSYRGVYWCDGRWRAEIFVNARNQHLGVYDTEETAARAYDEKAKQINDGRPLNFLPDGSLNPDRKPKYPRSLHVKAPKSPSTYRGVFWRRGRWMAMISVNGRSQSLGTYDTEEAAARAYDEKAKQLHDNPILNFLPDGSLNPDRKKRGNTAVAPPPQARRGARHPRVSVSSSFSSSSDESTQGSSSSSSSSRVSSSSSSSDGDDDKDAITIAIKEEETNRGDSGSKRRSSLRRRRVVKQEEKEEDAVAVGVKEEHTEDESGRRRSRRKRGRWAQQQEELDKMTVGIEKEEEEGDVGTVVVKEEEE